MKSFFRTLLASALGTFIALGFVFFMVLSMVVAASMMDGEWESEVTEVRDGSVLQIVLDGPFKDHVRRRDILSSLRNYDEPPVTGLFEVSQVLKAAAADDRIKGLFLDFRNFQTGVANAEALRRQVLKFKESGKFVMAYSEVYSELDYLVASAADEVILYPKGYFEWDGVYSKNGYFKNTLKKLEVVPQVFRVGKYKSAIEPFIADKMSEASREQTQAILDTFWDQLLIHAAEKTKLSTEELNKLADSMGVLYAKDALEKGFVNLLASQEEVSQKLQDLTQAEEKPKFTNWRLYHRMEIREKQKQKANRVAVVFASGGIGTDDGDGERIASRQLTRVLETIRRKDEVKAVVVRVNSPGGSALASDVIWTATNWLKEAKPVVTSFGNVAASGGYYMSAGSQMIFAEPTTITGSIGVFGLSLATKDFFNNKIGMTFDTVKSHEFADLSSLVRQMKPAERLKMQAMVDDVYENFLGVVVNGREAFKDRMEAHEIAQGRVWSGVDAKSKGLVDELGGLDAAIAKAAEFAEISDYSVEVYPRPRSPFQSFLEQMGEVSTQLLVGWLPQSVQKLMKTEEPNRLIDRVQMRMPFDIEIK